MCQTQLPIAADPCYSDICRDTGISLSTHACDRGNPQMAQNKMGHMAKIGRPKWPNGVGGRAISEK